RDHPEVAAFLPALDQRILDTHRTRTTTNWLRPAPLREALAALALAAEQHNSFRLPATTKQAAPAVTPVVITRRKSLGERLGSAFRGLAVKAAGHLRQPPAQTAVHIGPVTDYNADLADLLQRQYRDAFRERVPLAGKRVVLKPNLVEYH